MMGYPVALKAYPGLSILEGMSVRRFFSRWLAVAMLATVFVVPQGAAIAQEEATVSFVGAGWGHGVGLSQYGAYGASKDGYLVDEITSHYYTDSTIGTLGEGDLSAAEDIWVSLRRNQETITLIARKITYSDTNPPTADVVVTRGGDSWTMGVNETLQIDRIYNTRNCDLMFKDSGGALIREVENTPCDIKIEWDGNEEEPTRKMAVAGCEFTDWNGSESAYPGSSLWRECQYGRGYMVIKPPGDGSTGPFDVTVIMDMEDYVLGISEMPYYWGLEQNGGMTALEAQAIAARSYARELMLYRGDPGANSCGGWCHVRDDTSDQRYVGWGHGWSTWTAAVENTAGQVITHPAASDDTEYIVRAYYSSSSGGATENVHEVWSAFGNPVPYLTTADDHWALTSINPYRSWTVTKDADYVAGKVGLDTLTGAAVIERNTSGSAKTVRFTGIDDGVATYVDKTSVWVDQNMGLRSIYFDVQYGQIDIPPFNDIDDSVHYDDIIYIADLGITKGCNPPYNTQYCPDTDVTRGEMAAFLVRALDLTDDGGQDWFTDDDGSIFESDINKLRAAGITAGCNGDGTEFCPNDPVSRGEMAAFLVRGFGYTDPGPGDWFDDDDESIFEGNIDRLRVAGVTMGCNPPDNTNFCPEDPVQRDQMASFLARALRGQT